MDSSSHDSCEAPVDPSLLTLVYAPGQNGLQVSYVRFQLLEQCVGAGCCVIVSLYRHTACFLMFLEIHLQSTGLPQAQLAE